MTPNKCPNCGSLIFGKLKPTKGTSHILIEANQSTNNIIVDSGLLVDLYGCATCKSVQLVSPNLRIQ